MHPETKIAEVRVSKLAANILSTLLTLLFCVAGVVSAHVLPGYRPFAKWHLAALLVSFVALLPVHEGIHALGLLKFAKVSRHHIRFGVMWRHLMPYCHCTVPIPIYAYRRMGLF